MHWRRNIQPIQVLQKTSYRAGMLPRDPLQSILFLSRVRVSIDPFVLHYNLHCRLMLFYVHISISFIGVHWGFVVLWGSLGFLKKCCLNNALKFITFFPHILWNHHYSWGINVRGFRGLPVSMKLHPNKPAKSTNIGPG